MCFIFHASTFYILELALPLGIRGEEQPAIETEWSFK